MDQATQALSTAANLAAQEAADWITNLVSDHGLDATDHLAANYNLALRCIRAVAPSGTEDAQDRLDNAIDRALEWHSEETQITFVEVLEGSGLV